MSPRKRKAAADEGTTSPDVPRVRVLNDSVELVPVDALRPHPDNPRKGNVEAIRASLEANGFYGTVIVQKSTGYVLAGNHRLMAAREAGATAVPVSWVDVDDDHAKRILLADNRTNDLAEYDHKTLADLLTRILDDTGTLLGTGYESGDLEGLMEELAEGELAAARGYTQKVTSPIYRPTGPPDPPADLYDTTVTDQLLTAIRAADLEPDLRAFLEAAAHRHTVFRYDRIANAYAHAPADVQRLMEDSALVIIDFDRAIELGFVKLTNDMFDAFEDDHPDA